MGPVDDPNFVPKFLKRSNSSPVPTANRNEKHAGEDDPEFVPKFLSRQSRGKTIYQTFQTVKTFIRGRIPPTTSELVSDVDRCAKALDHLCRSIIGRPLLNAREKTSWQWVLKYLEARVSLVWQPIVIPAVEGLNDLSEAPSISSRALIYEILAQIADHLEKKVSPSLCSIVAELKIKRLLKIQCGDLGVQFVFQATGWLTAIWDPAPDASITHLKLQQRGHTRRRRSIRHRPSITQSSLPIKDCYGLPLFRFLSRYGSLLPTPQVVLRDNFHGGEEAGPENISAAYLSFHILEQYLNIKLEWTCTLSQHLELSQRNDVLYIFRLPSLCYLMYGDKPGTLLSNIYREMSAEHENDRQASPRLRDMLRDMKVEDYFVEVLLSYDLIFAREATSRDSVRRHLEQAEKLSEEGQQDPLLYLLCTKERNHPEVQAIYKDVDAAQFRDYIPVEEFPFLGERLLSLEKLSKTQNPRGIKRLWVDRRNMNTWFALWAVLILGGGTFLLQVIQLLFQVLQVWTPKSK